MLIAAEREAEGAAGKIHHPSRPYDVAPPPPRVGDYDCDAKVTGSRLHPSRSVRSPHARFASFVSLVFRTHSLASSIHRTANLAKSSDVTMHAA